MVGFTPEGGPVNGLALLWGELLVEFFEKRLLYEVRKHIGVGDTYAVTAQDTEHHRYPAVGLVQRFYLAQGC